MRPGRAAILKTAAIIAAWTAYGLFSAWQAHYWYAFTNTPMTWPDCLRFELTYSSLWALATPLVVSFSRRFRLERSFWLRRLPLHIAFLLVLAPAIKTAYDAGAMPPKSPFRDFSWTSMFRSVESNLDIAILLYALIVLLEHALAFYQRYQSGLTRSAQLQTQLAQSQLHALKMQLHPHFLFNTLNSVSAMVHEDPELAERTIARLSELLRLFLANSTVHEVALGEELRVLDLYLEIERARFEDRLRVDYDVPAHLRDATVPSLLLQPLVENSIRHGLAKRSQPGVIRVAAEVFGDTLMLRVSDNGAGLGMGISSHPGSGLGLSITRGRLESLYGVNHSLTLRNLPSGGAEARITLPLRIAESTEPIEDHVELQSTHR